MTNAMSNPKFHSLEEISAVIKDADTFILATHTNPDADALGSMLSLWEGLKNAGKRCYAILPGHIPSFLVGMPHLDQMVMEKFDAYCLIVTDTADDYRVGGLDLEKVQVKHSICIDHHASNPGFMEYNYVDATSGSTCELIHRLIKHMEIPLSQTMATWLYTGLVSDTGRFLYDSTSAESFTMAGELFTLGIPFREINQRLFQQTPFNDFLLNQKIIGSAQFFQDKSIVISRFTLDELKETKGSSDSSDHALNQLRDLKEVEVSVLIKETNTDEYKVSMRSKNFINVGSIAQEFGGGGHIRAAGFTHHGVYDDLFMRLKNRLEKEVRL